MEAELLSSAKIIFFMKKQNLLTEKLINDHFNLKGLLIQNSEKITQIAEEISLTIKHKGCVFWCGNGGSAADAQHLSAEFLGRFEKNRKPMKSIALTTDTSALTALSNDYNFDIIFSRQLEALAEKKDILIVFSTSGNSKNIINALKYAKKKKLKSIAILGNNGGKAKRFSNLDICLPIKNVARIQEMHILIGHIICSIVEKNFIKKK